MRNLVAVAVAKHNEMPRPVDGWSNHTPLVLEMMPDGALMSLGCTSAATLESDAQTVVERRAAMRAEGKKKERWSKPKKPKVSAEDRYEAAREALADAPDVLGDEYDGTVTTNQEEDEEDDDGRF